MSTILEALKDLNEQDLKKMLVLYYKDQLETYVDYRKRLSDLQGKDIRLSRTGHTANPYDKGYIKEYKDKLVYIENQMPYVIDLKELVKVYKKMSEAELSRNLSPEDRKEVETYIERLKLKDKLPRVGQKFKFSYLPVTYEVSDVDMDKGLIYYKTEGRTYPDDMTFDSFLQKKSRNGIYYV